MIYRGSDATEREGSVVALSSGANLAAGYVLSAPYRIQPGTSNLFGLRVSRTDRRALPDPCFPGFFGDPEYARTFGVNGSRANCRLVSHHFGFDGCSTGPYLGLQPLSI